MADLYRKADEAGNTVQLNATPTDDLVKRIAALEAICVPADENTRGFVQPDNDTIVILNGKLVATGLHMAWNENTDYQPGWIVRGPDGKDYVAQEPIGPGTNIGPKDPSDINNNQYWEEWSGGGKQPVIIPVPTILGNLAPIAGQQYTYTFEVTGIALDSVAKFEVALSLKSNGNVTTQTAEVAARNNVATWPYQVPASMRNGDTITMQVVAVDALGNRSDPAIANLSVGVVNVDKPTITAPTSGTVHYYMTTDLTVRTTPFTIRGATDTHESTDWIIASDNLGQNVVASALKSSDLTSHTFTKAELAGMRDGVTYFLLARHKSKTYGSSDMSQAVSVMAKDSYVNQPRITSPKEGDTIYYNANGITLTSSAFAVTGGTDIHDRSEWQITTDRDGNRPVLNVTSTTDKLSHTFTADECKAALTDGQTYYAMVRHKGVNLASSAWSERVAFVARYMVQSEIEVEVAFGKTFKNVFTTPNYNTVYKYRYGLYGDTTEVYEAFQIRDKTGSEGYYEIKVCRDEQGEDVYNIKNYPQYLASQPLHGGNATGIEAALKEGQDSFWTFIRRWRYDNDRQKIYITDYSRPIRTIDINKRKENQ